MGRIERKNAGGPSRLAALAPESEAERFRHSRAARRMALTEDYVELIADLTKGAQGRPARAVDLVGRLGVAQPTVAKALARLRREGFVVQAESRGIALTPAGQQLAVKAKERHRVVVRFLERLGVSPAVAERDAEGIEHHVSEETLRAFAAFAGRGDDKD